MSVKITQIEGRKLQAEFEGLKVISGKVDEDSPMEGMSPGKLMAASLGLCTTYHVLAYLKRHNLNYSNLEVYVDTENEKNPNRAIKYTTHINVKAELSESQKKGLHAEANRCYVGNTLKSNTEIDINIDLK